MNYALTNEKALAEELKSLRAEYDENCKKGYSINMARGVPCKEQLALSGDLLDCICEEDLVTPSGVDTRNYGVPTGLSEVKRIFAPFLEASEEEILVGGGSSLNLIYDIIADGMLRGFPESKRPWKDEPEVKILCPVPGYDRHFAIFEALGITMIPISLSSVGPDIEEIRSLCKDPSVKGMIAVPKYSNPDGFVFSAEVIDGLAALQPSAEDFKFFWDNAYGIHDFYGYTPAPSLFSASKKAGTANRVYTYMSTSKVTFPGSGVSVVAADVSQIEHIKKRMNYQIICYDKVNQLRHARFFGSPEGLLIHMQKHAEILRPKFEATCEVLSSELSKYGFATWNCPKGGYFVSLNVAPHTAKKVHKMMKELGILMTSPGATFPYGLDPEDKNLRIAPTSLDVPSLKVAISLLCLCAKICAIEEILAK